MSKKSFKQSLLQVTVIEASTSVVDMGPAPSQPIDPTSVPRNFKPISVEEYEEPPSHDITVADDVTAPKADVITADDVAVDKTPREETNSITSLEDLTLSESVVPVTPVLEVVAPVPAPQIDLDVLERISCAPPIAVAPPKKVGF